MAKVKIQGHASGTGILTVTAPNTSTDRTITLPDATGTLATTADTLDPDGAVVFNESGADVDFRVESDDNANMLFVDGGLDNVGIGVVPDSEHHANRTNLQVGAGTNWSHHNDHIHSLDISANAIEKDSGVKQLNTSYESSKYQQWRGTHLFKVEAAGNTSITWDTALEITNDGRGLSQFTAKAWIYFNMSGASIYDSHNISSITDNGTGNFSMNLSNALGNTNYSVVTSSQAASTNTNTRDNLFQSVTTTTSLFGLQHVENGSAYDSVYQSAIVFGD